MLQAVSIAPSTGFIGTRLANLGEVTNKGIELSVFGTPVQTRNFGWDARVNLSTNANKLIELRHRRKDGRHADGSGVSGRCSSTDPATR